MNERPDNYYASWFHVGGIFKNDPDEFRDVLHWCENNFSVQPALGYINHRKDVALVEQVLSSVVRSSWKHEWDSISFLHGFQHFWFVSRDDAALFRIRWGGE